ncbi:MAG: energy transducer TonB [Bryobacteraceae bacterium]
MISLAIHAVLIAALLLLPFSGRQTLEKPVEPPLPPIRLHLTPAPAPDPGGGGTRSPTPPTKGQWPQYAKHVFVPPVERTEAVHPLIIEPSVDLETPPSPLTLVQFGDPNGKPGPPSGGRGLNGIGDGLTGGLGDGAGPGGGGSYEALPNGPTTGPVPIYNPDPEFSEEARKAKLQGQVILEVVVDTDGRARLIRIRSGLGLGLDEKAIQAVETWRFKPGRRNGRAIAVPATIYINFRLL